MSALDKPLLGIFLLTFVGVSWAACPEGQKQTYKGCEVVEEKATEAQPAVQQEAKEVDSEILELGGFIAEEIQIEAAAGQGDTTEMTASLDWDNEGDDWRGIGFNVDQSVDDGAEIVGGRLQIIVSWTGGSEKEPDRIRLKFDSMTLPSIDYQMMRGCNGWDESLVREDSTIRLAFWGFTKFEASRCIYNKLSQADQALVSNFVNQIYNIVEKGTEGAPDADYWKKIAFRIRVNSPFILSSPASGHYYCINAEDGALVVYLAAEGNCQQSEHEPIERLGAASKVRALLKDMSLDAISQNELGKP